jgi:acyl-CoA thioester hydrolase
MPRIKIDLPPIFSFSTFIPIRITDLNYGSHVGNDSLLSILHESRVQFLQHYGFKELNEGGSGLIMSDVVISFKNEIYYGDRVRVSITAGEFTRATFDIFYKLEKEEEGTKLLLATAKTGMVCFDYRIKKIIQVPADLKQKLR